MPFIQVADLENTPERKVAPDGEYDVRIKSADLKERDNGRIDVLVVMEVIGEESYENVLENITGLISGEENDKKLSKMRRMKAFLELFDIPIEGGFNNEDLPGAEARVKLGAEEYEGKTRSKLVLDW